MNVAFIRDTDPTTLVAVASGQSPFNWTPLWTALSSIATAAAVAVALLLNHLATRKDRRQREEAEVERRRTRDLAVLNELLECYDTATGPIIRPKQVRLLCMLSSEVDLPFWRDWVRLQGRIARNREGADGTVQLQWICTLMGEHRLPGMAGGDYQKVVLHALQRDALLAMAKLNGGAAETVDIWLDAYYRPTAAPQSRVSGEDKVTTG